MNNFNIHHFIIINLLLVIYSCDGLEQSTGAGGESIVGPTVTLTHLNDLVFEIGAENFDNISYLQFSLDYDKTKFTFSNIVEMQYGTPVLSEEVNYGHSFVFIPSVSQEVNTSIIQVGFSGSSYNDEIIKIVDLIIIDENDSPYENVNKQRICFINGHRYINEGEVDWFEYEDYLWSNSFCIPSND